MPWTNEQKQAIELRDENILVAAAAGSGKTAVLIERIKSILLSENDDKASLENILVLTFTNAAAAEMKQRLQDVLRSEIKNSAENRVYLQKQLEYIFDADISTFHAFAQKIIKKYFYKIGINPKSKVMDSAQEILLKDAAINIVFNNHFNSKDIEKNENFINFLKMFSPSKNEKALKEKLIQFYERLMSVPKPFEFLKEAIEHLLCKDEYIKNIVKDKIYEDVYKSFSSILYAKKEICELLTNNLLINTHAIQNDDVIFLNNIIETLDKNNIFSSIDLIENLNNIKMQKGDDKEVYNEVKLQIEPFNKIIKDTKKHLKDNYSKYKSIQDMISEIVSTYESGRIIYDIIKDFHYEYKMLKVKNNFIDFSDIEHNAIEILEDEDISKEYNKKFKYIFIDEYQDTNDIQEYIISLIKRKNNLFMVGDLKQSIYRFRLAEPEIFEGKYFKFEDVDEFQNVSDREGVKIDLNKNFRSRLAIIKYINSLFKGVLKNYDENAQLNLGVGKEEPIVESDFLQRECSLLLTDKSLIVDKDILPDGQEVDSKFLEVYSIVKEIKNSLGKKYVDKHGNTKIISYRDIVILTRQRTEHDFIKSVLEKFDIPSYAENRKGYFDKIEILSLVNLLKVIQNKNEDLSFISVLTNWFFKFTPQDLSKIRASYPDDKFTVAFKNFANQKESDDKYLQNKCIAFQNQIKLWRKEIKTVSIEEFLLNLINYTGMYQYLHTLSKGKQREINTRAFIQKLKHIEEYIGNNLKAMLAYIDKLINNSVNIGEAKAISDKDDVVKIMTIHASKGEEFPVVFLSGTHKKFISASKSIDGNFFLSKSKIFYIKNISLENKTVSKNILEAVIKAEEIEKNIDEEKRILYVAMTRAREKLVLTGIIDDDIESQANKETFLGYILSNLDDELINVDIQKYDKDTLNNIIKLINVENLNKTLLKENIVATKEDIKEILNFSYKYEIDTQTRSKYSVSELNKEEYNKYVDFDLNVDISLEENVKSKLSYGEIGSIYHKIMEDMDFHKYKKEGRKAIEEIIDKINNQNIYEENIYNLIHIDDIEAFFSNELGLRAMKHDVVKEKSFRMLYEKNGGSTVVQGIIDCYFEEDDGKLVLIDYKSNLNTYNLENKYKTQMSLYKKALQEGSGKDVKEVWLYSFKEKKGIKVDV